MCQYVPKWLKCMIVHNGGSNLTGIMHNSLLISIILAEAHPVVVAAVGHRGGPSRVAPRRPPEAPRHQPLLHPRLRHAREGEQRPRAQGRHALARQPHMVLKNG